MHVVDAVGKISAFDQKVNINIPVMTYGSEAWSLAGKLEEIG